MTDWDRQQSELERILSKLDELERRMVRLAKDRDAWRDTAMNFYQQIMAVLKISVDPKLSDHEKIAAIAATILIISSEGEDKLKEGNLS